MSEVIQTETPVKEKPSLFGMILNPGEQFKRLKENPKIWIPLLMVTAIFTIAAVVNSLGMDIEELLGNTWQEELDEEMLAFVAITARVGAVIGGVVIPILTAVFATLIFLLVSKFTDSEVRFRQLFSMNIFIFMISALGSLFQGIVVAAIDSDPLVVVTSLQFLVQAEGKMSVIFSAIEVFSIWHLILVAVGLKIVANFKSGLAWGVAIVYFIVPVLIGLLTYSWTM